MGINAIPSNAYWLTSQPRNAEKQAVSTETAAMQDTAKSASSSVTVLSARNNTAGQNIPTYTSAATNAALLATQEVEAAPTTANTDPTPWEVAGYTSRREWLLSGEYVPEGMEGRDNYVVFVALDEVPEEIRLIREKKMQEEFENPLASYERRIASAEEGVASAERSVEHAYEMLARAQADYNKYQSEFGKYPDFEKDINGRIANAHVNIKEAQERVEKSKAGVEAAKASYEEAVERIAAREPGPVFNIIYKLTDMVTPVQPGDKNYEKIEAIRQGLVDVSKQPITVRGEEFASLEEYGEKMRANAEEQRRADMLTMSQLVLESAQQHLGYIKQLAPESAVPINATISIGTKLVAHIDANGFLVPQDGGQYLYSINQKADALGLKGQQRTDFIKAEIAREYSHLKVTGYTAENRPTQREFAQQWFPDMANNMDADYQKRIAEAYANVQKAEELYFEQLNA